MSVRIQPVPEYVAAPAAYTAPPCYPRPASSTAPLQHAVWHNLAKMLEYNFKGQGALYMARDYSTV